LAPVTEAAPKHEPPPELEAIRRHAEWQAAERDALTESLKPYRRNGPHSFFRDLWRAHLQEEARGRHSVAMRGLNDEGRHDFALDRGDPIENAHHRLKAVWASEARDLSSATATDVLRPSAPGWIADVYGQASRQAGTLAEALERRPLLAGMVDTASGVPVISGIPRLTGGAAVAIQASQNSAVQETDPATASVTYPVGMLAGQVDMSRMLFERSSPSLDEAISRDLGADFGLKLDVQLVNGSGAAGQLRGLLNVSGVLSVTGSVASAAAFQQSVWQAYSAVAGTSGVGANDPQQFLTILHPRRYAWLRGNTTGIAAQALLPGTVVVSAGSPTNLGAGTNEDRAIIIDRTNVILAGGEARFAVYEEVGSSTLTVRVQVSGDASLLVLNPAAVAVVTGLSPPAGF